MKKMAKAPISAVILTLNEEAMVEQCLATLNWCNEVIIIDSGSTDKTLQIVQKLGAKVIDTTQTSFAAKRTEALEHSTHQWIFYVDADERVTPALAQEISDKIKQDSSYGFSFKRSNIFFGSLLNNGGWGNDVVPRLFIKKFLKGWTGEVHESPIFQQPLELLVEPLLHFSHRDVLSGLIKTINWTPVEAKLISKSLTKKISIWTIVRKSIGEFWRRVIISKSWKDGEVGMIESMIQIINRALVYIQVWELQQKNWIDESYLKQEKSVRDMWKDVDFK